MCESRPEEDSRNERMTIPFEKTSNVKFEQGTICIVETNVDDVSGEVISRTIERALTEGAEDASAIVYLGKKGREGFTLRIVCSVELAEKMSYLLVQETGTLGVKISECTRLLVPRRIITIPFSLESFHGQVKVKVAEIGGRIVRIKPEVEDAKQISESENVPLREVLEKISIAARDHIK